MSIPGLAIFRLADAREGPIPDNLNRVERAPGDDFEFLAGRERRNLPSLLLQGQEVRERVEKTVFRCAAVVFALVFVIFACSRGLAGSLACGWLFGPKLGGVEQISQGPDPCV